MNINKTDLSFFLAQLDMNHLKADKVQIKYCCSADNGKDGSFKVNLVNYMTLVDEKECDCNPGAAGFQLSLEPLLNLDCSVLNLGSLRLTFHVGFFLAGSLKLD